MRQDLCITPESTSPVTFIFGIAHEPLAVDDLPILRDRHVNAGAALGVDELDRLRHGVGLFPAVLHGFKAQTGAVHMRVLRALVGRHL